MLSSAVCGHYTFTTQDKSQPQPQSQTLLCIENREHQPTNDIFNFVGAGYSLYWRDADDRHFQTYRVVVGIPTLAVFPKFFNTNIFI